MKAVPKVIELERGNENLMVRIKATNLPKDTLLVVPETHSAILIKDGRLMDTLNGGKYPLFDAKSEKKSESISVEIVYLSKTVKLKANWGTKAQFQYRDAETDLPIRIGARGEFEVQISNPRKAYLELIGMDSEFKIDKLRDRLAVRMLSKVEPAIAKVMVAEGLPFDRISLYKEQITSSVFTQLSPMFEEEYGLRIFSFTFEDIFANPDDAKAIAEERRRVKLKGEALDDDERLWNRQKFLVDLEKEDYDKYLAVCKIIGWEPKPRSRENGRFCPHCGGEYEPGAKFCPNCGGAVGLSKKVCPKCGRAFPSSVKFCSACGEKL